ncbi:MAG: hypothetical protein ACOC0D_09645, partial [Spirochaeta sp.]
TWYLGEVQQTNPRPGPELGTPSTALEAGFSFPHFDIAAVVYYGWNGRLLITQNTALGFDDDGQPADYIMTVSPVYARHLLTAVQSTGSVGQFWWWVEASAAPHTRIPLAITAAEDTTGPESLFTGTGGIGWFLPAGYGQLLLETTYQHIISDISPLRPAFDRAIAAAIDITPPAALLKDFSIRTAALLEYPDTGLALSGELRYQPHPQFMLSLSGLTFVSSYGAFVHSYQDNHLLKLTAVMQF